MKITSRLILAEDKAKKGFQKVTLKLSLPSGEAKNNTILGPLLGQHQINIMSFCNEFNLKSSSLYELGVILPVFVSLKKDKTYILNIRYPALGFFIEQISNINQDIREISFEKLYDVVIIIAFFLNKNIKAISYIIFGYLSSFNKKIKIIF